MITAFIKKDDFSRKNREYIFTLNMCNTSHLAYLNRILKSFKITFAGRVQGVGFRPFIYNLALNYNFKGEIVNNQLGVIIYLNGSKKIAEKFIGEVLSSPPKLAIITSYDIEEIPNKIFTDFKIKISETSSNTNIPLTPDFALCAGCKIDVDNPNNRRHNYAFTTCVNCGPRYSITKNFPFERHNTSLAEFMMCKECRAEYEDQKNRRFHSQTNSCEKCGIELRLITSNGKEIIASQSQILDETAIAIKAGKIVAIKNTNGYLLCADAKNSSVIQTLRNRKKRAKKPLALMYPNFENIQNDFKISEEEEIALKSEVAAIVLIDSSKYKGKIAVDDVAPGLQQLGVMLPASALMHLLLKKIGRPIVATSGNINGSPIIANNEEAIRLLKDVADLFLQHDLTIEFPQDDSVVKFSNHQQIIMRRSRGLAPNIFEDKIIKNKVSVLAMGAQLKSTLTYLPNKNIYVSEYFGNLDNYDVVNRFRSTLNKYKTIFGNTIQKILVDKHPNYQSTIIGKELQDESGASLIEIQHHKAHFCSVMAEHNLFDQNQKVLGVIWDGTGFGDDGNIWGGEFFVYYDGIITRKNNFENFNWIAADKMAREPRLSLLCLLNRSTQINIKDKFSDVEWKVYEKLLENNTLKTSSVGRLFDAVACILGLSDICDYEGEAAMLLENLASKYNSSDYLDFLYNTKYSQVPTAQITQQVITCLKEGLAKERIAMSFIYTLAKIIINQAKKLNTKIIACSGGVFQNTLLVKCLQELTLNTDYKIKINRKLSCNDENISLGQLYYYLKISENKEGI
ncbi:Hydrogenase maturation protein, carbamoyltransferase HypF [Flavobacteriaceae bacterium MAR_2010_188]|nr:Hydrogenase maturation protein, carbamoyltransferase HypF [Flavobacteriaceae bacterium MAR_2010_188]